MKNNPLYLKTITAAINCFEFPVYVKFYDLPTGTVLLVVCLTSAGFIGTLGSSDSPQFRFPMRLDQLAIWVCCVDYWLSRDGADISTYITNRDSLEPIRKTPISKSIEVQLTIPGIKATTTGVFKDAHHVRLNIERLISIVQRHIYTNTQPPVVFSDNDVVEWISYLIDENLISPTASIKCDLTIGADGCFYVDGELTTIYDVVGLITAGTISGARGHVSKVTEQYLGFTLVKMH